MKKKKFLKELGKRIRAIRKAKGLSQTELADIIKNHQRTITRIERAEINASIYLLKEIAHGLGVKLEDLIKGLK